MAFSARDPILAMIEDRASFLRHLIDEYPNLLKSWEEKTEKQFRQEADSRSRGDSDVYETELNQMLKEFESDEHRKDIFFKGMLALVYTYYESMVNILTRGIKASEKVKAFCNSNGISLSSDAERFNDWIGSDVRILRNHVVHKDVYRLHHNDVIKRICKEWDDVNLENNEVRFSGSTFIQEALLKEEQVLRELCSLSGHQHHIINTKTT